MTILETKIAELKEKLFRMAALAETMLTGSMEALVRRDPARARQVIEVEEPKVNALEMEVENDAIGVMALHQPEATALRTLVMITRINANLERIGDHAVNIAEAACYLADRPQVKPLIDLPRMSELTVAMLADALDAFARGDAELARDVCGRDSTVDALKDQVNRELVTYMISDPATIDRALKLMMVSLNLERVADLATNIAEDAIYSAQGRVIKHGAEQEGGQAS
ncbi:MAG TPA: phosphate signaling complex protein PhoU [candidate division WOR-3 bacterium]|uniref:Phosphate-specific transport system accessory protein PhoU n=1 Tax=candidate division WOR-3 bacterium TaxID=2052148 RepID=A0A7V0T6C4_UNCW3|nr:phosphate signaling complex protein PhoU [candidate division WOR-3 bacterium]